MLNTVITGQATEKTPLLIVHGLFGSARNWGVIAKRMSQDRQVISVDMRNHGTSFRANSMSYANLADDLAEVLRAHGASDGTHVLGHSMGGKATMMLALTHPELVKSLIVADISPVTYEHTNKPLIDAMQALDLSKVEKRSDADAMLAVDIFDAGVRAFLLQSLVVKDKNWLLNLQVLEDEMPKIVGWPDGITSVFDKDTFFLSGAESSYVSRDHRAVTKSLFPKAKFASLPDTGHWLHAEKPREFEAALTAWLSRYDD
ncbi:MULTISPECIES: alpha/beta fold hydrolase [Pacificibacter]|uniref:alpha/beta fold hydrolase n=1 Tax=Pacificibacter TaxID=1042323 RepID=UPI001C09B621|nr:MULTISPECIES: alpha/beta fold hydrolase [Pacificibacter]MBU2935926.1 alpha/beta fold hydrolase [Pacificibacter marinus]MDO6614421.1 alpha/beta fold hydrolase [Pacificibacter sp. 1_MG-2023]